MVNALAMGLKGDDTVTGLAERFDSANSGKRILSIGTLSVNDGHGGGNYIIDIVDATASGSITRAPLKITANNVTLVDGSAQPAFTASFSGFPVGLGPSALLGALTFTTTPVAGMPGHFEILPGGLSSSNFAITFVPGTLVVTEVSVTPTVMPAASGDASSAGDQTVSVVTDNGTNSAPISKLANFVLPPVPFAISDGSFAWTNRRLWSDPVEASVFGSANEVSAIETGNLIVPVLDENGNPLGRLIGFNSTFIETCRARATLCR